MQSLKEQISIIDEDYLAGISNRGILKRAQKDLAESRISVSLSDNALEANFADGTVTKINDALGNFQCTCPSRTICKHVIMALIQASRDSPAESPGEPSSENPPEAPAEASTFDYLLAYNQESLVKDFGKTSYNDVLFKLMAGATCEIEETSILGIKVMEGAFTVRFLPNTSIAESICSCKTKNCRHRLEAIMHYIKYKTGKLDMELVKADSDVSIDVIVPVINFIEDIFRTGLVRLPAEYSEKCAQFAVLCHGAGFALFERLFETCGKELALYEQKSALFNRNALVRNLSRIYQMCREIQQGGNEKAAALAGKFRRQYMELPTLRILGMGAYPWYAKSGFCGVTAVFHAPELGQNFTFTFTRPVTSEAEAVAGIKQIWQSQSAWKLPLGLGLAAKGELSLTGAKISEDGRLSSSEGTSAFLVKPQTAIELGEIDTVVFDDFTAVKNLFLSKDLHDGARTRQAGLARQAYAVLKIAGLADDDFNRVTQTYTINLIDKFENRMALSVKYSKINETAILNLEHLAASGITPNAITVSIAIPDEGFLARVFPIALWLDGKLKNIDEEKLFPDEKKSTYAKFFE
ncbi:MAG: SWIM zinc finger family protein [Spirochaetes bacterium]|nr:SWIM zinc finger family protein [Spirochaetota bacterium]